MEVKMDTPITVKFNIKPKALERFLCHITKLIPNNGVILAMRDKEWSVLVWQLPLGRKFLDLGGEQKIA
jgi:hypothetical protein